MPRINTKQIINSTLPSTPINIELAGGDKGKEQLARILRLVTLKKDFYYHTQRGVGYLMEKIIAKESQLKLDVWDQVGDAYIAEHPEREDLLRDVDLILERYKILGRLVALEGWIRVEVENSSPITLSISGTKEAMDNSRKIIEALENWARVTNNKEPLINMSRVGTERELAQELAEPVPSDATEWWKAKKVERNIKGDLNNPHTKDADAVDIELS